MNHSVSIEPRFVYSNGILSKFKLPKTTLVQGDVFKLGLKITNTGEQPISSFTIKDIEISSAGGQKIFHLFKKEYATGILNPNDEKILWISDFGTDMFGLATINLNITPPTEQHIDTYQINRFNSEEEKHFTDSWTDFFYVKSSHEHIQEQTNNFLLALALATMLVALTPFFSQYIEDRRINEINF